MTTPVFDLLTAPLDCANLLEASAGTGKTYTLAGLFLRLILEQRLSVDQILVVTFTEAATEELRCRIRTRLRDMLGILTGELEPDDALEEHLASEFRSAEDTDWLAQALRNFDLAQIYTIHGFCQRMLSKNGFECATLFETELRPDISDLRRQVCMDFWRDRVLPLAGITGRYVRQNLTPENLMQLGNLPFLAQQFRIEPELPAPDTSATEQDFLLICRSLQQDWPQASAEVRELMRSHGGFKANMFSEAVLEERLASTAAFLASPGLNLPKRMSELSESYNARMLKKGFAAPEHMLFGHVQKICDICSSLEDAAKAYLVHLKTSFLQSFMNRLDSIKTARNVKSFDDLLRNMHVALGRDELIATARAQYRAALIDEFQDTDSLQYEIFHRLFATDKHSLFLIGDPKQAIYSFRGADLHTYLRAAQECPRKATLGTNYRSTPELIAAVNHLFHRAVDPFRHPNITFHCVNAPDANQPRLTEAGHHLPPLIIWRPENDDKPCAPSKLLPRICASVAAEICRLLVGSQNGVVRIGENPLQAGDIAILVETHAQGEAMHKELLACAIPSVLSRTETIFASEEAGQMLAVLHGIAEYRTPVCLRTALVMPIFGLCAAELEEFERTSTGLESWMERMRDYHLLWKQRGIMACMRRIFADHNVRTRLVSRTNGERCITNFLHCLELLHAQERETSAGMQTLITWFARQLRTNTNEEFQLHLDTDRDAVQILTIHKSKGLQFPVVFCPFLAGKTRDAVDFALVHEEGLLLDFGSARFDDRRRMARNEAQAERIRLLYVALTRAKARCYMVWGRIKGAETSGAAWLFHAHRADGNGALDWKSITTQDVYEDLSACTNEHISLQELAQPQEHQQAETPTSHPKLQHRIWSRALELERSVSSFSGLTRGTTHPMLPGLDDDDESGAEVHAPDISNFPRGAMAGNCLHRIFELIDFNALESVPNATEQTLKQFGFAPTWAAPVQEMVLAVLNADLGGFRLSQIQATLAEMEFLFPLRNITTALLAPLYRNTSLPSEFPRQMETLRFEPQQGFMTGFMDLVIEHDGRYHLLDWKSNWLGPSPAFYDQPTMHHAMTQHLYFLQYHLYCVALNRYLQTRVRGYEYSRHFGGVHYIFLRGVAPRYPGNGIYEDKPDQNFLAALDRLLIGGE